MVNTSLAVCEFSSATTSRADRPINGYLCRRKEIVQEIVLFVFRLLLSRGSLDRGKSKESEWCRGQPGGTKYSFRKSVCDIFCSIGVGSDTCAGTGALAFFTEVETAVPLPKNTAVTKSNDISKWDKKGHYPMNLPKGLGISTTPFVDSRI